MSRLDTENQYRLTAERNLMNAAREGKGPALPRESEREREMIRTRSAADEFLGRRAVDRASPLLDSYDDIVFTM